MFLKKVTLAEGVSAGLFLSVYSVYFLCQLKYKHLKSGFNLVACLYQCVEEPLKLLPHIDMPFKIVNSCYLEVEGTL